MSELKININKIIKNYLTLREYAKKKKIIITPVTKVVAGDINIVKKLEANGAKTIADSRIYNIKKFIEAGINSKFLLLRLPSKSEICQVVKYSDFSLNSSEEIISKINEEAKKQKKQDGKILMI